MCRLAVSLLLVATLASVASADWDYSSRKFGAGVGISEVQVYEEDLGWFPCSPFFPNYSIDAAQFWGRRLGLAGIRLLEHLDFGREWSDVDAMAATKFPFGPYSSVSASFTAAAVVPRLTFWKLTPTVRVVWNQNDQDFLISSRELWYAGFGLRADISAEATPGDFHHPVWWHMAASSVVPYTFRFDWGRVELGPRVWLEVNRPLPSHKAEGYEPGLDLKVHGGRELTDMSRFPEEHGEPALGWVASVVPKCRVWRHHFGEGESPSHHWRWSARYCAYSALRVPVVRGFHIEPALAAGGYLKGGSLLSRFWPFLSFGYVHPLQNEKYLVARLGTRAWSWRAWESPQLSLTISYGCREVTRVGDDETMQGPGGTMNPWKEQHQNPSP